MNIQELIDKYKAEWVKAKSQSTFITKGGYTKTNAEQLGRLRAFTQMINDLVELQILLNKKLSNDTSPQLNKRGVSGRSEQLPHSDDDVRAAAEKHENDNGDYGSFVEGAQWVLDKLGGNCH